MADCSDCLELVTEDGQDQGDYRGHCLHCRQEITASAGINLNRPPGAGLDAAVRLNSLLIACLCSL